jgi:Type II site-specific deoxyribonuclease
VAHDEARLQELSKRLKGLSVSQVTAIDNIVHQFERPIKAKRLETSDLISPCVLEEFGDTLQIHHCFSAQALSKDRFEFALERCVNNCGRKAVLSPRNNPGADIAVDGVPMSLKTQADKSIKVGFIHISKFMELGKGEWDLEKLLGRYLDHMKSYERVFTLRHFKTPQTFNYELVEIPKNLLLEAKDGALEIREKSKQSPKPGNCTVTDAKGRRKFVLYFDAGTERKLQVKHIDKSLCIVHADWTLNRDVKITEASTLLPD